MIHFETAGAESDLSRFSSNSYKVLICHYSAGCSLSSLVLTSRFLSSSYCLSSCNGFMVITVLLPHLPFLCLCAQDTLVSECFTCSVSSLLMKQKTNIEIKITQYLPHITW